ncbi:MAG: hypothetical protein ACE10B_04900, partial [Phycisphaerales bacterium]
GGTTRSWCCGIFPSGPAPHWPFPAVWYGWQRRAEGLTPAHQEKIRTFVESLNESLAEIRPFGHRVNQAIHAYVANYPDLTTESRVQNALADTLMLRILPKLRGIELEDRTPQVLRRIAGLAQEQLGDDDLANSIEQALRGGDVFLWTG